jgi:hypothetical protein
MTSNLPTIALILAGLSLLLAGYCTWQMVSISRLKKTFFAGDNALSLESVIYALKQELEDSRQAQASLENSLAQLKNDFTFSVQRVGLVRFNPFNDGGGNFSFCLAMLDQNNTGVVITSMYGREQNRIYTKKVDQGKSDTKLTEEEEQAVARANDKFQIPNSK